ncbi:SNF2 helicase associated domain-containing protein [Bacillus sp. FSL W7-1360]
MLSYDMLSYLDEERIERAASSAAVYRRGHKYYRDELVKGFTCEKKDEIYTAVVRGSRSYYVRVSMLSGNLHASCDCPAFAEYRGACKHIVAVLLALPAFIEKEEQERKRARMQTSMLLTEYEEIQPQQFQIKSRKTLSVAYELTLELDEDDLVESILISLRVGESRLYVVKHWFDFLEAIQEKETYPFTSNFTYYPNEHQFSVEDEAMLLEFHRLSRVVGILPGRDRYFSVPVVAFSSLLAQLSHLNTKVSLYAYGGVIEKWPLNMAQFSNEDSLFSFSLMEGDGGMQLHGKILANVYCPDEPSSYVLKEKVIFTLTDREARELDFLVHHFFEGEMIDYIPTDQLESFCSKVLPMLKRYGTVELSETLREKISRQPLQGEVKIDYEGDRLLVDVRFCYGEVVRNPLSEEEISDSSQVLVRDLETEQAVMSLLNLCPFKQEASQFVMENLEDIGAFLFEQLPPLKQHADVLLTNDARKLLFQPDTTPSVSVDVEGDSNWLDVGFAIEGISEDELSHVLQSLQQKKKYHRLSNGALMHLQSDDYVPLSEAVEALGIATKDLQANVHVPLHKAFSLEDGQVGVRLSKKLYQLIRDVQSPEYSDWELPTGLVAHLRTYQETGFRWMRTLAKAGLGGVLADDMGLGKTLQTITHLQAEKEGGTSGKALVIAPASVIFNWEKEVGRFAPALSVAVIAGTKANRDRIRQETASADVWITSYPLIQREADVYADERFHTLILDEAQAIKNEQAKTTKAVRSLKAASCFALSGTPIENRLDELYTLMQTVIPGLFGTKKQFKARTHENIARLIRPFLLRRLKTEVLTELPDKIESVQYTELLETQKKYYLAQVKQLKEEVDDAIAKETFQKKRIEILAGLTKLRQLCCHPKLVTGADDAESGKLSRLLEYVEEALAAGQRLVIFSQFTSMLTIIKEAFIARNWDYFSLDGSTPASERLKLADQFNDGEKSLFLVSLKAGGTGLNLTGGDTVILYDTWWNPAIEEQAADRVYRFGQKKNVQVIKLIANGTIEEKILALHEKKKALVDAVIQPGEKQLSAMSVEEIKELLAF